MKCFFLCKRVQKQAFDIMEQIFVVGGMIGIPYFVVKRPSSTMLSLRKGNNHKVDEIELNFVSETHEKNNLLQNK